jgi:hypothetical protein
MVFNENLNSVFTFVCLTLASLAKITCITVMNLTGCERKQTLALYFLGESEQSREVPR